MTLEEYRNNLLPSERLLFDKFVPLGIKKTIYALLDAKVTDSEIQRVVIDNWNIPKEDFPHYLIEAKKEIALYLIWQHLTLNEGYSPDEADRIITSHMIKIHLSHDHELLKQWNSPEKILKSVQKKRREN